MLTWNLFLLLVSMQFAGLLVWNGSVCITATVQKTHIYCEWENICDFGWMANLVYTLKCVIATLVCSYNNCLTTIALREGLQKAELPMIVSHPCWEDEASPFSLNHNLFPTD